MAESDDCIFCRIVRREAPAVTLYEDAATLAFLDIYPASVGHTLVISKVHYSDLLTIEADALSTVMATSQRLARAIMQALTPAGLRVAQFNGVPAGQTVFHYHVHLRPVYLGQDLHSHGRSKADPAQLEAQARWIRAALSGGTGG